MEEKRLVKRIGRTKLYVVEGDITQIPTDAIMTAINSGGMWFGGIDGAIQKVAGNTYHSQAGAKMPLKNLQVVVAKGDKKRHNGQFDDVIFVVDDLESPLEDVIYTGLETANKEGYSKLLLPAVRLGVMRGVVEKTPTEAITRISKGINTFMTQYGAKTKLEDITFVIYNDFEITSGLTSGLKAIENSSQ